MNANTHAPPPVGGRFFTPHGRKQYGTQWFVFVSQVDRRRSDTTGFFTDMQVSSPTAQAMSVKKGKFLHRHSNVTEGS
ncbi:hypothetical protein [Bifidobacterium canis]|uniref:hypothetical protein n=1 Tax=Bifidobacterium canis TaxID=2610880 RepID=UPI0012D90882|nr:hypothetical protein [Bifidobacterium canis]